MDKEVDEVNREKSTNPALEESFAKVMVQVCRIEIIHNYIYENANANIRIKLL